MHLLLVLVVLAVEELVEVLAEVVLVVLQLNLVIQIPDLINMVMLVVLGCTNQGFM
jgi:hypothetical protein